MPSASLVQIPLLLEPEARPAFVAQFVSEVGGGAALGGKGKAGSLPSPIPKTAGFFTAPVVGVSAPRSTQRRRPRRS